MESPTKTKEESSASNLIPQIIGDNYQNRKMSGVLSAATMFLDIKGFTAMTQSLMVNGKEGAEVLNDILKTVFEPVIAAVYNRGGFISGFEGDAFLAVFPDASGPLDACHTAKAVIRLFEEMGQQKTRFGSFALSVKIGLGFGRIDWQIVGSAKRLTWYFYSRGIDQAVKAEKKCDAMNVVLSLNLFKWVSSSLEATSILGA